MNIREAAKQMRILQTRIAELEQERDIFQRTLDKRDEELSWYRNHAIQLGSVIEAAPHASHCHLWVDFVNEIDREKWRQCDCWKSKVLQGDRCEA